MADRRARLTVFGRQLLVDRVAVAEIGARHKRTPAFSPQVNGKSERFNRTMLDEWAHGPTVRVQQ